MSVERDVQREVAHIALTTLAGAGFVLAGSGAIREHGVIERPTEDVDLFTTMQDPVEFDRAVKQVVGELHRRGYGVDEVRRSPQFARLRVSVHGGAQVELDLGVDWRENDPVPFAIGPVLSLRDAVASKIDALYSRGEPRDFLDVDGIRRSGEFADGVLVDAAAERDPDFDIDMFARQLEAVNRVTPLDVRRYGVTPEQLEEVKSRCLQWAAALRRSREQ
ncbi:nucleotidyl transferase AbiEii/AbiGii toxin family protein [Actinomyces sp. Z5]|uniref:nucleotidyl transferase AbiEii/AbiGii toxin family protein n=1 Tax=Actinomyces sp. Z5 TaxID=2250216 RepID=UPI001C656AFA|nr:nucleotidyl transferase AbiEii/AbiGii toxin family protein [Actinomyces sp. Z5]